MFQAIQIETQAEQQGLTPLHAQAAAGRPSRELALDRGEDAFDQRATPIDSLGECPPHLRSHSVDAPCFVPALRRNHTPRSKLAANVGVVPLAVEFAVGQHPADGRFLRSGSDDRGPIRTVVPGAASRHLRQQELFIQIRYDHPFQPVPPRQRFLPMMMQAPHKERADGSLRQARGIDSYTSAPPFFFGVPRNRCTISPTARSMTWSSRRCRKRYRVVWSGTLDSCSTWRNS
jgi:hypothetical protein